MAAMFGTPGPTESLGKEASISKPGDEALKELRSQMAKKP